MSRTVSPAGIRRMLITAMSLGLTVGTAACTTTGPESRPTLSTSTSTASVSPASRYLDAWADNDVRRMRRESAPGAPARDFANYWGEVLAAGRVDTDSPTVNIAEDSATVRYSDGTEYWFRDFRFDPDGRLVSWTSDPGGPLAERIVGGPTIDGELGPVTVHVRQQYRNTDDDLRITMSVRNSSGRAVRVGARAYVSPGGSRTHAALGSDGRTGVVPIAGTTAQAVVVAVPDARPGGRLSLFAYVGNGKPVGETVVQLPR